ncbi:MAG: hypothetical protein IJX62_08815 [Clostridia bacterium]|nr:hypothetical protein [Clostridia bacterium]
MDNLIFEPINFIKNLGYMGAGMLGIFVVIGLIVITTMILNRASVPPQNKDDED